MSKQALRPLNRWVHGREPYNAFAFDIDGVLLHGKSPIGGAVEAMKLLLRARPRGGFSGWVLDSTLNSTDVRPLIVRSLVRSFARWRLPVAFLTNGGGMTEQAKAEELTDLLRLPAGGGYRPFTRLPLGRLWRTRRSSLATRLFARGARVRGGYLCVSRSRWTGAKLTVTVDGSEAPVQEVNFVELRADVCSFSRSLLSLSQSQVILAHTPFRALGASGGGGGGGGGRSTRTTSRLVVGKGSTLEAARWVLSWWGDTDTHGCSCGAGVDGELFTPWSHLPGRSLHGARPLLTLDS